MYRVFGVSVVRSLGSERPKSGLTGRQTMDEYTMDEYGGTRNVVRRHSERGR
jgi:hypothetical protein